MNQSRTVSVSTGLRGMPVIATDTGDSLGEVLDAVLQPTTGLLTALIVRTDDGDVGALPGAAAELGRDRVLTDSGALLPRPLVRAVLREGVPAVGCLVGALLVTEDGRLVGHVADVYVAADGSGAVYRIARSPLDRVLGRGLFLPAKAARSYSPEGSRLIVPADVEARHGHRKLSEVARHAAPGGA